MKIKDLKRIIEKLPDEMIVASLDRQGICTNAIAYIDGEAEGDCPEEWLVVDVADEGDE